ncbi:hypothetical protein NDU88_005836 [Pleurodeles waltl]|uniref:Uncharacterized protein n=1 Tax=Pleurodeles waltl TaxID=8319 RepID=A0AAV7WVU4_PLEWA|nr:hypothetical protein NDU88_005836 [Pleurodeles waltl]
MQHYAWAFFLKNAREIFNQPGRSELGQTLIAMMEENCESQKSFLHKYGDPKFFKKVQSKVLQGLAKLWYAVRRVTNLSCYSKHAPVWVSPGSPEWTKDDLATPLKEAGLSE